MAQAVRWIWQLICGMLSGAFCAVFPFLAVAVVVAVTQAIEQAKRQLKELEEEAALLRHTDTRPSSAPPMPPGVVVDQGKLDADARSIYVGNVDYGATPEELQSHFSECGTINRVTILVDKYTQHPKGYAYVEFMDKESVDNALALDESVLRGRQLKVTPKRTNVPGMSYRGRGRGRYRGGGYRPYRGRGRGMYRGGYQPYY